MKKIILSGLLVASSMVFANEDGAQNIKNLLSPQLGNGLFVQKMDSLDLYAVVKNGNVFFTDANASYLIKGEVFDIKNNVVVSKVMKTKIENLQRINESYSASKLKSSREFVNLSKPTPVPVPVKNNNTARDLMPPKKNNDIADKAIQPKVVSDNKAAVHLADVMAAVGIGDEAEKDSLTTPERAMQALTERYDFTPSNLRVDDPDFKLKCVQIAASSGGIDPITKVNNLVEVFNKMSPDVSKQCGLVFAGWNLPKDRTTNLITYKSPNEKRAITIISDFTCAYCKKLHESIPSLNNKGITVRVWPYLRGNYLNEHNDYTIAAKNSMTASCLADNEERKKAFDSLVHNPAKYSRTMLEGAVAPSESCIENALVNKMFGNIYTRGNTPIWVTDKEKYFWGYASVRQIEQFLKDN